VAGNAFAVRSQHRAIAAASHRAPHFGAPREPRVLRIGIRDSQENRPWRAADGVAAR